MKKILTLLTICALPLFAGAQETAPTTQMQETAIQTEQTDSANNAEQSTDNSSTQKDLTLKDMPTSHLIGCIIAFIVLFYIGIKLCILKALLAFFKLFGGDNPVHRFCYILRNDIWYSSNDLLYSFL